MVGRVYFIAILFAVSVLVARPALAGEGSVQGCFFEAGYLEARIAGATLEARRAAAERRGAALKAVDTVATVDHAANDIDTAEEALAKSGMCIYPADYVDTLAQDSMAPPRDAAPVRGDTGTLIAQALAGALYGGGMTALPTSLSTLIADAAIADATIANAAPAD